MTRRDPDLAAAHRTEREQMVTRQIVARGVDDPNVLDALREVPREAFVGNEAVAFAYDDCALPIGEEQTISQPYVVALMTEAAQVGAQDRVLEIGTGSGYQAAVLSRIATRVFTIERHRSLAESARRRFEALGYTSIETRIADGTMGWPEEAPFDAIIVTAGGPERIPQPLLDQLAPGGRLVIPVGDSLEEQALIRIRRADDGETFQREELGAVRFVPLIGKQAWAETVTERRVARPALEPATQRMTEAAEAFDDPETANVEAFLTRVGDARLVLLGEATHGTSEFYRMRARLTRALIEQKGFDFVALEADWPDASELDAYVRHAPHARTHVKPFQRFPQWMWGNHEVLDFMGWLRGWNETLREHEPHRMVGVHGLDLYSLYTSIDGVVRYLDEVDPDAAAIARTRYACLTPWQHDPVLYGRRGAAASDPLEGCEREVVTVLQDLLEQRAAYSARNGDRFAHAFHNARVVRSAEAYYREMYRGSVHSWNLRDRHMYETLEHLLAAYGPESRGIVWAHNSHLGDARATSMGEQGELNLGQLAREAFGPLAYLVGFGTDSGTVMAASDWDGPTEIQTVLPAHPGSYEHLAHRTGIASFFLPLRVESSLSSSLTERRLQRAIGVVYRPRSELQSHYIRTSLPRQFDEWIWFDQTEAVQLIAQSDRERWVADGVPETFPFGL